jgi:hypothetical protein
MRDRSTIVRGFSLIIINISPLKNIPILSTITGDWYKSSIPKTGKLRHWTSIRWIYLEKNMKNLV